MQKRNKKINFLLIFLYLQPFLDIFTSFQNHFFPSFITVGVIVRILFLIILFILLFRKNTNKNNYIYFLLYFLYICIYSYIMYQKGAEVLPYELKNVFHILYFPLTLQSLKLLSPEKIEEKHFIRIYVIYVLLLIIPCITNTSFEGYKEGKTGVIGWFYATNEISAILALLMPFAFHDIFHTSKNRILKIIFVILLFFAIFNMGSKIPVLTFLLLTIIYTIHFLKIWIEKKKYKLLGAFATVCIITLTMGTLLIPKTSIYYNMKLHLNFLGIHHIQDIFTTEQFIDHFIFSQRLSFLKETNQNYWKSTWKEKLFGIGYIENYQKETENRKTIEMDYFDIFYRTGIIGTLLFYYPLVKKKKEKQEKKKFSKTYQLSTFLAFFIAGFAGHVLTSPAVSIYLSTLIVNKK